MMNKLIGLLVAAWLAVGFVPVAQSGFEEGVAAYKQGDYDTALKELKPIAEQGDADVTVHARPDVSIVSTNHTLSD